MAASFLMEGRLQEECAGLFSRHRAVDRQRPAVKGPYDEMPTDMNVQQIARLKPARIAAFNLERRGAPPPPGGVAEAAARHVVTCFEYQRRNIAAYGRRGVFFTYEAMCAEPERVASEIRALVPELDDLNLRQRLRVRRYNEALADMNARQIARLKPVQIATCNRVFRTHRDLFHHFGYELLDGRR